MQVFLERFSWTLFIAFTFLAGAAWWWQSRTHRKLDPSTEVVYQKLIRGFLFWGNIPWLLMGIETFFLGKPSESNFYDLTWDNPVAIATTMSIVVLWALGSYWLFARDGAEQLSDHPSPFLPVGTSAASIKFLWLVAVAVGILSMSLPSFW